VVQIEIVGPASIAPGGTAQYSAIQYMSDGSNRPATGVAWSSSQPSLIQVDASGLATAQAPFRGDATLQVELPAASRGLRRGSRDIVVLPDGTFRLVGTVIEADATGVPVGGARLEAAAGESPSSPVETFATTGPDGRYKLYGVPSDATLRVIRDGYVTTSERIHLSTHETRNFELRLVAPRRTFAGDYTMTIEAGNERTCTLPEHLRQRVYETTIAQNGPFLTVKLTSPEFLVDSSGQGNQFSGVVTGTGARFELRSFRDYYYYPNNPSHPDVVERLPDATLLVFVGNLTLTGTSTGLSGTSQGWLSLYQGSRFPSVNWLSGCSVARLTLTQR
jgi:hypothetical protein